MARNNLIYFYHVALYYNSADNVSLEIASP